MPRRIEDFRGLTQSSRLRLLHAVQRLPGRLLQELAAEVELHVNTAREHLQVLEEEGLIIRRPMETGSRGRPPMVFDPVAEAEVNDSADRYVAKAREHGDLLRRIEPGLDQSKELGEAGQHQVDVLYTHLEDAGFDPVFEDQELSFDLHPCVYHGLIAELGTVVCAVHASLVRNQLAQVTGPLKLRKLDPFVTPHMCRLRLTLGDEEVEDAEGGAAAAAPNDAASPSAP